MLTYRAYIFHLLLLICFVATAQAQPAHKVFAAYEDAIKARQVDRSVQLADKTITAAKKQFPAGDDSLYQYLMMVGYRFFSNGYNKESLPFYKDALPLEKKRSGEDSEAYQNLLSYVASTTFYGGNFKEANTYYEAQFRYRSQKYKPSDSLYIDALFQLANTEHYTGKKKEAIEKYRVIKQWYNERKIRDLTYASLLSWYGGACFDLVMIKEAEALLTESAAIYRAVDATHPYYYAVLHQLALLYIDLGAHAKAIESYEALLPFYRSSAGRELDYASALSEMAGQHRIAGRYEKAEDLLNESLAVRKKYNAPPDQLANSYNELANLHLILGNNPQAELFFRQAMELREKHYGKDAVYSTYIHNLGIIYSFAGDYQKAMEMEMESAAIYQKLNPHHPAYMQSLANICYHLINMQRMKEAEKYLDAAMEVSRHMVPDHPHLHELYMVAGIYNHVLKKYTEAAAWYEKARALYRKLYERDTESTAVNRLSNVYIDAGDYKKAFFWQKEKNERLRYKLTTGMSFLSEAELMNLSASSNFTDAPAMISHHSNSPEAIAMLYNNLLFIKGLALNNNTAVANAINASGDTSLISLWNRTNDQKKILYEQELLPPAKRIFNTDSLAALANDNEKLLVKRSQVIGDRNAMVNATWQTVQQQLQEQDAAIEFVRYKTGEQKTDSALYAALIVTKNSSAPIFVKLCSENQLMRLLNRYSKNGGDLYQRGLSLGKTTKSISSSKALYELIWQPISKHLQNTKQVYFSPDGLLHRIAFAALPVNDTALLLQQYSLSQLFSTRDAGKKSMDQKPGNILLAGGIDYNAASITQTNTNGPLSFIFRNRSSEMAEFSFLPGTLQEVKTLGELCRDNNIPFANLTGQDASETNLRMLSGKAPSVIHISTHGFSLPDEQQAGGMSNSFTAAADPLVRCGLVLAGGNLAWKTKQAGGSSDGILTAKEISTMNLRGCELAVLSACETGLGNIKGTEGVFGLQRGLKTAGVQSVIVSLWSVPDKETVEFMQLFYTGWFNTGNKEAAFRSAQLAMQQKYPPGAWAAFVMIQ